MGLALVCVDVQTFYNPFRFLVNFWRGRILSRETNEIVDVLQNNHDTIECDDDEYELPNSRELIDLILLEWDIRSNNKFCRIFAWAPPVQLLYSSVGQYYWYCVCWKFYSFIFVSLSFWSPSAYHNFKLNSRNKEYVPSSVIKRSYLDSLAAIVVPRAVLWQIIPQLSVLSMFTQHTASSPFTSFPDAHSSAFVFFDQNPFAEAWSKVKEEQWVKYLMGLHNMTVLWWPFKIAFHLFNYGVVLALVFAPISFWKVDSPSVKFMIAIVLIQSFCKSLEFVIMYGKWLDLRDTDLICKYHNKADANYEGVDGGEEHGEEDCLADDSSSVALLEK